MKSANANKLHRKSGGTWGTRPGDGALCELSGFSPRTNVLGHSQSSLRDLSRWECIPRTYVLGYSQPSLRD